MSYGGRREFAQPGLSEFFYPSIDRAKSGSHDAICRIQLFSNLLIHSLLLPVFSSLHIVKESYIIWCIASCQPAFTASFSLVYIKSFSSNFILTRTQGGVSFPFRWEHNSKKIESASKTCTVYRILSISI